LTLVIINCYAPTEKKKIKDNFYEDLEAVYNGLHCVKIIVGDLNAKIGKESSFGPAIDSLHNISNENGTRMVNFAHSKALIIRQYLFPMESYIQTYIEDIQPNRLCIN